MLLKMLYELLVLCLYRYETVVRSQSKESSKCLQDLPKPTSRRFTGLGMRKDQISDPGSQIPDLRCQIPDVRAPIWHLKSGI